MMLLRTCLVYCLLAILPNATFQLLAADLETVTVDSVMAPRVYRLDGVVEAARKTTVAAQISGQVEAILYDVDDYVEKGEVVVRLKDKQPAARLKQAEAELSEARARLEEAEEEYERVKGVFEKQAVSKKAMDAAEAAMKAAQAKFEAASAGLEQAQEQLEYTRVRAPYAGIVTERHVEVGETAQPGKKLISGLSLAHLRVNADVPQSMINAVREAAVVNIRSINGDAIPVSNTTIFPYAEPASHTFRVRLDFNAESLRLFPGMFVKVEFEIGQRPVLVVPTQAIVHRSEVTAVYVRAADGKLSMRAIRPGRVLANGITIVLAGLQQGEQVVINPVAAGVALKRQRSTNISP